MRGSSCLLLAVLVLLAGCAKPTEEQRLEKFRRSIKYRTYRLASEKATANFAPGTPPAITS